MRSTDTSSLIWWPRWSSLLLVVAVLAAACDATQPTASTPGADGELVAAEAASSGTKCHGVRFDMLFERFEEDIPPLPALDFAQGTLVAGDLEGTVDIDLLDATFPTGDTNTATFRFRWNIDGGVIPELIGESFVTIVENRNLFGVPRRANDPPDFGATVGTHRAESGVRRANLSYIGEAFLGDPPPPFIVNLLHHRGVICP
jgi:hypothetical protein